MRRVRSLSPCLTTRGSHCWYGRLTFILPVTEALSQLHHPSPRSILPEDHTRPLGWLHGTHGSIGWIRPLEHCENQTCSSDWQKDLSEDRECRMSSFRPLVYQISQALRFSRSRPCLPSVRCPQISREQEDFQPGASAAAEIKTLSQEGLGLLVLAHHTNYVFGT